MKQAAFSLRDIGPGLVMAATGLAAHALYPGLSVEVWGILHSLLALMLLVVISCAVLVAPGMSGIVTGLFMPSIPEGSVLFQAVEPCVSFLWMRTSIGVDTSR